MSTNGQFGSIRKLPSGRFQVRYFHLGRRITGDTTFPTKGDARAFLAGVETDIRRGNFFDPSAGRVTFAEYSGWWLDQRSIRPRTRQTYESQLTHLLPTFGSSPTRGDHAGRRTPMARPTLPVELAPELGVEDLPALPHDPHDRGRRRAALQEPGAHSWRVERTDDPTSTAQLGPGRCTGKRHPASLQRAHLDRGRVGVFASANSPASHSATSTSNAPSYASSKRSRTRGARARPSVRRRPTALTEPSLCRRRSRLGSVSTSRTIWATRAPITSSSRRCVGARFSTGPSRRGGDELLPRSGSTAPDSTTCDTSPAPKQQQPAPHSER